MNCGTFQARARHHSAGFTLLEVSTALGVMVVLSFALVIMLQQHLQFLDMFKKQSFLANEAPKIGNMLGRIINEADHYFVYATKTDALAGGLPVLTNGKAVMLYFKSPNPDIAQRLITVETTASGAGLYFYTLQAGAVQSSWTISSRISDANFLSNQGILNVTLSGPNGELVTYGGGAR